VTDRSALRWLSLPLLLPSLLLVAEPARCSPADNAAGPAARGVLEPRDVSVVVEVPREGLWRPAQGDFVCPETVCVRDEQGRMLECVSREPGRGQYRVRLDGCIRFCADEAGREVSLRFQYRPRRVAVLPAVVHADYEDALPTMQETLTRELGERGFIIASDDDLADALAQLRAEPSSSPEGLSPDRLSAVAKLLDAAYLLLPGVSADEAGVLAGFRGYSWVTGSAKSAHTTATAVTRNYMNAAVGITVFDGVCGEVVFEKVSDGSKRVRFRRFGPARRDLIRDLSARLVADWRQLP